jgi:hypothetical protein
MIGLIFVIFASCLNFGLVCGLARVALNVVVADPKCVTQSRCDHCAIIVGTIQNIVQQNALLLSSAQCANKTGVFDAPHRACNARKEFVMIVWKTGTKRGFVQDVCWKIVSSLFFFKAL